MNKHRAIQISIPQPCSKDWHKMMPQEQGRYCDSCKKCVVDFTGFTDGQLYQYFIQHAGEKVCGHFRSTQLNRSIVLPPQPHSKLYRIAVALGLAIAIITTTEQKSFAKAPCIEYNLLNYSIDEYTYYNQTEYTTISGRVLDENGEPLINAIVEVHDGTKLIAACITDYNGDYVIKTNQITIKARFNISIRYIGMNTKNIAIVLTPYTLNTYNTELKPSDRHTLGEFIIIEQTPPYIDTDNPGNKTITSDQIKKNAH